MSFGKITAERQQQKALLIDKAMDLLSDRKLIDGVTITHSARGHSIRFSLLPTPVKVS